MLKRSIISSIFIACALLATAGFARAADEKIALVSFQQALNMVNEGKKAREMLQQEYDDKKKQLEVIKADLEKMSQNLEKQQMVLSAEALQEKRKELQTKYLDLQNKMATYERELNTKHAENTKKIIDKLRQIVITLSQDEGYTLVIENSADMVLYSKNATDITEKVIAAYNKTK